MSVASRGDAERAASHGFSVAELPAGVSTTRNMSQMVDLEDEFQRLCGGSDEASGVMQVCDRMEKSIKDAKTLVRAEPLDVEDRGGTEVLATLRAECKKGLVLTKWVDVVLSSVDCHGREEFVDRLDAMLQREEAFATLAAEKKWHLEELPCKLFEMVRSNSVLQEELRRREAELEELRVLRQKYQEQARELEELRRRTAAGPVEEAIQAVLPQLCRGDGLDKALTVDAIVAPWLEDEPNRALSRYEALSREVREADYATLVNAMEKACRAECFTEKVLALEMDEAALATERAHLLYEQIVHWKDSYFLTEALESAGNAYERLKETAERIERRNITLSSVTSDRTPMERKGPSAQRRMEEETPWSRKAEESGQFSRPERATEMPTDSKAEPDNTVTESQKQDRSYIFVASVEKLCVSDEDAGCEVKAEVSEEPRVGNPNDYSGGVVRQELDRTTGHWLGDLHSAREDSVVSPRRWIRYRSYCAGVSHG
ncbi:unnamed protein product, partial [Heligmosomoides polygyrus]|uniref:TPR_REGION domain-containing protein n=1 Tax=Heligmosomoides polygyrus TaxID=6339 RepID=A0A183FAG9_HELPZ